MTLKGLIRRKTKQKKKQNKNNQPTNQLHMDTLMFADQQRYIYICSMRRLDFV